MPSKKNEPKRTLPKARNPRLREEETPDHSQLIKLRRLGQTTLALRPGSFGQNGNNAASQPQDLGLFDYAHLQAPLPSDLLGSEIFATTQHQKPPEAYFLMRRSSDGFVSASGMFKAAFPFAKLAEELVEKEHIKSLMSIPMDEVAGNLWIPEPLAIDLADEYGILPWIQALLDPADITPGLDAKIAAPPRYTSTAADRAKFEGATTPATPGRRARTATPKARGRARATASPEKSKSPTKSAKRGRPPKDGGSSKTANGDRAISASVEPDALLNLRSTAEPEVRVPSPRKVSRTSDKNRKTKDAAREENANVNVNVESVVETLGDTETTTTNVKIQMPAGSDELPLPENPEEMIAKAKEMVKEARRMDGIDASPTKGSLKRKADVLDDDDDDEEDDDDSENAQIVSDPERLAKKKVAIPQLPPAKRARIARQEATKVKVRARALVGVAVTVTLGALIPYLTG